MKEKQEELKTVKTKRTSVKSTKPKKQEVMIEEKTEVKSNNIITEQVYTKQAFKDFATFTVRSSKSMIVIYICAVIIALCGIVMLNIGEILEGVMDLILALFFGAYGLIMRLIMKFNNRKNVDTKDIYEFSDDKLFVTSFDKEGNQTSTSTINYANLHSVRKYKNYGYIYINKAVAYIFSQENFKDVLEFNVALNKVEDAIFEANNKKL